jgi:hypothetical protein
MCDITDRTKKNIRTEYLTNTSILSTAAEYFYFVFIWSLLEEAKAETAVV